jgi:hypothetical protein
LKAKPDGQTRGASRRNDGKVAGRSIGGASRRGDRKANWKVDPRRKSKVRRKAQPENAATRESEVGFARQGRKVSRRRESKVSWRAAPKGFSSR